MIKVDILEKLNIVEQYTGAVAIGLGVGLVGGCITKAVCSSGAPIGVKLATIVTMPVACGYVGGKLGKEYSKRVCDRTNAQIAKVMVNEADKELNILKSKVVKQSDVVVENC